MFTYHQLIKYVNREEILPKKVVISPSTSYIPQRQYHLFSRRWKEASTSSGVNELVLFLYDESNEWIVEGLLADTISTLTKLTVLISSHKQQNVVANFIRINQQLETINLRFAPMNMDMTDELCKSLNDFEWNGSQALHLPVYRTDLLLGRMRKLVLVGTMSGDDILHLADLTQAKIIYSYLFPPETIDEISEKIPTELVC